MERGPEAIQRKTCAAADGVRIVYSVAGTGEPAVVFIHGGLATRGFWDAQITTFSRHHRVIAPDLPGHGESGADRVRWGVPEFGDDIWAVLEAERPAEVVIFGNSLGGPAAIEAALRLGGKVLAVVGVGTFQRFGGGLTAEQARERAEAFRDHYHESVASMVKSLFHADADAALLAGAQRRMMGTPPAAAHQMFLALAGYDTGAAARRLTVPLRAINGDLYPTDIESVRKVKPDFDAVIMKHVGHYPMLERPQEFDTHVADVLRSLVR